MISEDLKTVFGEFEREITTKIKNAGEVQPGEIPISPEQESGFQDMDSPNDSTKIFYFLIDPDFSDEWGEEKSHWFMADSLYDAILIMFNFHGPFIRGLTRVVWKNSKDNSIQAVNISEEAQVNIALAWFRPILVSIHRRPTAWEESEWGAPDFRSERYLAYQQKRIDRYG